MKPRHGTQGGFKGSLSATTTITGVVLWITNCTARLVVSGSGSRQESEWRRGATSLPCVAKQHRAGPTVGIKEGPSLASLQQETKAMTRKQEGPWYEGFKAGGLLGNQCPYPPGTREAHEWELVLG